MIVWSNVVNPAWLSMTETALLDDLSPGDRTTGETSADTFVIPPNTATIANLQCAFCAGFVSAGAVTSVSVCFTLAVSTLYALAYGLPFPSDPPNSGVCVVESSVNGVDWEIDFSEDLNAIPLVDEGNRTANYTVSGNTAGFQYVRVTVLYSLNQRVNNPAPSGPNAVINSSVFFTDFRVTESFVGSAGTARLPLSENWQKLEVVEGTEVQRIINSGTVPVLWSGVAVGGLAPSRDAGATLLPGSQSPHILDIETVLPVMDYWAKCPAGLGEVTFHWKTGSTPPPSAEFVVFTAATVAENQTFLESLGDVVRVFSPVTITKAGFFAPSGAANNGDCTFAIWNINTGTIVFQWSFDGVGVYPLEAGTYRTDTVDPFVLAVGTYVFGGWGLNNNRNNGGTPQFFTFNDLGGKLALGTGIGPATSRYNTVAGAIPNVPDGPSIQFGGFTFAAY